MQPQRVATISAINEYIATLKVDKALTGLKFSLSFFNQALGVTSWCRNMLMPEVPEMDSSSYKPEHGTPLYDAIGSAINQLRSAGQDGDQRLLVIYTDGYENASKEYTKRAIIDLVGEKLKAGWQVVYLGADLDSMADAQQLGVRAMSNYSGRMVHARMDNLASNVSSYAAEGTPVTSDSLVIDYDPPHDSG
jgi:hypothetical protein